MLFQFMGFEILFMFYPFLKNPEQSQKWAHYGAFISFLLYLFVALVTFVYFSEKQIQHITWPTLTLLKIAEIPLIERVEYIVVSIWLLVVLPGISLNLWAACRGVKRMANVKQHIMLLIFLISYFVLSNMLEDRRLIKQFVAIHSNIGFCYVYGYIPFLFVAIHLRQKIRTPKRLTDGDPTI